MRKQNFPEIYYFPPSYTHHGSLFDKVAGSRSATLLLGDSGCVSDGKKMLDLRKILNRWYKASLFR